MIRYSSPRTKMLWSWRSSCWIESGRPSSSRRSASASVSGGAHGVARARPLPARSRSRGALRTGRRGAAPGGRSSPRPRRRLRPVPRPAGARRNARARSPSARRGRATSPARAVAHLRRRAGATSGRVGRHNPRNEVGTTRRQERQDLPLEPELGQTSLEPGDTVARRDAERGRPRTRWGCSTSPVISRPSAASSPPRSRHGPRRARRARPKGFRRFARRPRLKIARCRTTSR